MNAEQFKTIVGHEPELDDLERANCLKAGKPGHWNCGVCAEHGKPVFTCEVCFPLSCNGNDAVKRIQQ